MSVDKKMYVCIHSILQYYILLDKLLLNLPGFGGDVHAKYLKTRCLYFFLIPYWLGEYIYIKKIGDKAVQNQQMLAFIRT